MTADIPDIGNTYVAEPVAGEWPPARIYDRDVLFACLTGSHNYNLDEEGSDEDWKMFVLPSLDDVYRARIFTKSTTGTERDCTAWDVRRLPELMWKTNPNVLDALFSVDIRNPRAEYGSWVDEVVDMRDDIARMNLPYLFNSSMGIAHNEIKMMARRQSGTFEEFGYDAKSAMHAYRTMENLKLFAENGFEDFGSVVHCDGDRRDKLLAIKHGEFYPDLDRARKELERYRTRIEEKWRPVYTTQAPDRETYARLDKACERLFRIHVLDYRGSYGSCGPAVTMRKEGEE